MGLSFVPSKNRGPWVVATVGRGARPQVLTARLIVHVESRKDIAPRDRDGISHLFRLASRQGKKNGASPVRSALDGTATSSQ